MKTFVVALAFNLLILPVAAHAVGCKNCTIVHVPGHTYVVKPIVNSIETQEWRLYFDPTPIEQWKE